MPRLDKVFNINGSNAPITVSMEFCQCVLTTITGILQIQRRDLPQMEIHIFRGSLSMGSGLCPGGSRGVSVQGALCPVGDHCPVGASVQGASVQGGLCQGDPPRTVKMHPTGMHSCNK